MNCISENVGYAEEVCKPHPQTEDEMWQLNVWDYSNFFLKSFNYTYVFTALEFFVVICIGNALTGAMGQTAVEM